MTPNRSMIADNIFLSTIKTDKFKAGLITFTVSIPLTKENIAYNMLLCSVLKRGTEKYPSIALLNKRLDELYSSTMDIRSARLGKNLTLTISADMLENRYISDGTDVLGGILELAAETVYRPNIQDGYFPKGIVEQEKRFLTDGINAIANNTRSYASTRLSELMFANDSEFPTMEELKDIIATIDNVKLTEYHIKARSYSPLNIFYVGGLSKLELARIILSYFPSWETAHVISKALPYPEPICEYKALTETMSVSQGKLALGFKVGAVASEDNDSHYTAVVFNELFGGSAASKLFLNVREKLSLCYYCSSSYDRYTGTMTVSSGIENKNREIAELAILAELEDIRNGRISDIELSAAKKSILNNYRQFSDSPYDLQAFYFNRGFFGFTEDIETAIKRVSAVSAQDISELAKKTVHDSLFFVEGASSEEVGYEE